MYSGLYDGGRAGIIYSFIWTAIGFLPIVASLAELSSMSPIAGGYVTPVDHFLALLIILQTIPLGQRVRLRKVATAA
jgi:hypothetical protein